MDTQNNSPENTEKLKDIPKWTRRYTQNRSLNTFIGILFGLLFSLVNLFLIAVLLVIKAAKRNITLTAGLAIGFAVILIVLVIVALKFRGKKRFRFDLLMERWIYGREGTVSMQEEKPSRKKKFLGIAGTAVWTILFIATLFLGMKELIPAKYILPVSALYNVPYQIIRWYFWERPKIGPLVLISPVLYTLHAVLIMIDVPLYFTGVFGAIFNLCLFFTLYNLLGNAISLFYSRYALRKLKGLTHMEGDAANGD